jgi:hypothetical protein
MALLQFKVVVRVVVGIVVITHGPVAEVVVV